MTRPRPGLQAFHDGRPVELLHRVSAVNDAEVWMVKPIFTDDQTTRLETFLPGDRLTPIHTQSH